MALPSVSPTVSAPHQVTECLQEVEGRLQALEEAWALRRERCKASWELQKLRLGLDQAEAWLASREGLLLDPNCGVSQGPALSPAALLSSYRQGQLPLLPFSLATQGGSPRAEGRLSAAPGVDLTLACFSPALGLRCGAAASQTPGLRKAAGSPGGDICPTAEEGRGEQGWGAGTPGGWA